MSIFLIVIGNLHIGDMTSRLTAPLSQEQKSLET